MQVEEEKWKQATLNLIERRKQNGHNDDNRKLDNVIRDYKTHLSKVFVGKTVLDVGCGGRFLETCVPKGTEYTGIDAFPVDDKTIKAQIETFDAADNSFETVCAFAVLDNCQDFIATTQNMKRIAAKNVVILTGIDIPVDKYHTFNLSMRDFARAFSGWKNTYREELQPKVWLLEYTK